MPRRSRRWPGVSFAGMAGGEHTAMIPHEDIERCEVQDVLHRRWPDVMVKSVEHEEPTWMMTAEDATDLGRCRRAVEPLRIGRQSFLGANSLLIPSPDAINPPLVSHCTLGRSQRLRCLRSACPG